MPTRIFISLGSNMGNRLQFLKSALDNIKKINNTKIIKISSIYETEPIGPAQNLFLNMVVELNSQLDVFRLFKDFKSIENKIGRTQSVRWGPREIDIDIIYFGDNIINTNELIIPHPEIINRKFVIIPLMEIAEDFIDPVYKKTISSLLKTCKDNSAVNKFYYT